MDATRLGHACLLPAVLLQEAAVGYLTGPQRTLSIESWRDTALAWATTELKGAVRALQPVPPPEGTGVAGYTVADYLIQYASRERRYAHVPLSTWNAVFKPDGIAYAIQWCRTTRRSHSSFTLEMDRHHPELAKVGKGWLPANDLAEGSCGTKQGDDRRLLGVQADADARPIATQPSRRHWIAWSSPAASESARQRNH